MAVELAAAYVSIIPSARGMTAQLRKELAPLGEDAGARTGNAFQRSFVGRAVSGISGLVDSIGRTLVSGLETAGVVAGGALGAALFTGWDRLTTIQDSTKALTVVLGDASQAGVVLDGVLDVVRGTPFRLDQFAAAGSQLVGFGADATKVPGYLEAIGDASAVQGKRANEFAGRLSEVFGQATARGRIQLQDVWRISESGVNALAILANHFGVTTTEMQNMISSGLVPAEEGLDALTKGIIDGSEGVAGSTRAFGGLAQELGENLSGGAANAGAALARFGANLIEPFTPALLVGFQAFIDLFDQLGESLGPKLDQLVNSAGFKAFLDWLANAPSQIGPLVGSLSRLGPALAPIGAAAAAIGSRGLLGVFSRFMPFLGPLATAINPLAAAIIGLILSTPELRDAFMELLEAVGPLLLALGDAMVVGVGALAEAALPLLITAVEMLTPLLVWLAEVLTPFAPLILGVMAAVRLLNLAMMANPIGLVIGLLALLVVGFKHAWDNSETFRNIVTGAFDKVKMAVEAVVNWVRDNWPLLLAILTGPIGLAVLAITKNWDRIKSGFEAVKNAIGRGVDWMRGKWDDFVAFFRGIPGKISSAASGMWDGIWAAFRSAINNIVSGWNRLSFTVPSVDLGPLGSIGGQTFSTPNIPMLAEGGIVTAATLALIGEARPEVVMPLDQLDRMLSQAAASPAPAPAPAGTTVEQMIVQAWSDRFDLGQVEDEVEFRGAS